jgi:hypothetical protein
MIILGLVVVFPEVLELKDFISEDIKHTYGPTSPVDQASTVKFFDKDVSPSRDEIKSYLLDIKGVEKVVCLANPPKITYGGVASITNPVTPYVRYRIIKNGSIETGLVTLRAKIYRPKMLGMPFHRLPQRPARVTGWTYFTSISIVNAVIEDRSIIDLLFNLTPSCKFPNT